MLKNNIDLLNYYLLHYINFLNFLSILITQNVLIPCNISPFNESCYVSSILGSHSTVIQSEQIISTG